VWQLSLSHYNKNSRLIKRLFLFVGVGTTTRRQTSLREQSPAIPPPPGGGPPPFDKGGLGSDDS